MKTRLIAVFCLALCPSFLIKAQTPVLYTSADTICRRHCITFSDSTVTPRPSDYMFVFTVLPPQVSITCLGTGCIIHQDTVFVTLSDTLTKYPPRIKVCYYSNSALNTGGCFPMTETITNSNGTNSITKCIVVEDGPIANAGHDTTICIGANAFLMGSSSSASPPTYSWVGPNGFSSNTQNSTVSNASALNSGQYILTVSDGYGCKDTASQYIDVTSCSGINQFTSGNKISVYPNPGSHEFYVSSAQNIDEILVTDLAGQIVYRAKCNSQKANFAIENRGMYFVTVKSGTQAITNKILVQ